MDLNFSVFQEPRGVMRIIQFVFSICAFATICDFTGYIDFICKKDTTSLHYEYQYPFKLYLNQKLPMGDPNSTCNTKVQIMWDFSSDSRFFVATGVISMLYCIVIVLIYTKFDEMYKANNKIPLIDFLLSVFISVLWLSSSASWANALSGIKHVTDPDNIFIGVDKQCTCPMSIGNFSTLNISVIFGFLNFFLWAADLWFLYKETPWFQENRITTPTEN